MSIVIARAKETPYINKTGALIKGCKTVSLLVKRSLTIQEEEYLKRVSVPGLDATLCRCRDCLNVSDDGIWWFDAKLRDRIIKRETAFEVLNRNDQSGELCRDLQG